MTISFAYNNIWNTYGKMSIDDQSTLNRYEGVFKYECNWVNFQKCLTNSAKITISILQNTHRNVIYKVLTFKSKFKWFFIIFSRYTVQTLENRQTEIFLAFDIFFQLGVFWASEIGKSHKGLNLANKEATLFWFRYLLQWPLLWRSIVMQQPGTTEISCWSLTVFEIFL
jgi:hypothetical protein